MMMMKMVKIKLSLSFVFWLLSSPNPFSSSKSPLRFSFFTSLLCANPQRSSQAMASHSNNISISTSPKGRVGPGESNSPKGQCLCSPTTHEGSFRCRLHRSTGSKPAPWFNRSKSMPPSNHGDAAFSPKSVEST